MRAVDFIRLVWCPPTSQWPASNRALLGNWELSRRFQKHPHKSREVSQCRFTRSQVSRELDLRPPVSLPQAFGACSHASPRAETGGNTDQ